VECSVTVMWRAVICWTVASVKKADTGHNEPLPTLRPLCVKHADWQSWWWVWQHLSLCGFNTNRLMNCSHLRMGQIVRCSSCGRRQVMPRGKHFSWMTFSICVGWFNSFLHPHFANIVHERKQLCDTFHHFWMLLYNTYWVTYLLYLHLRKSSQRFIYCVFLFIYLCIVYSFFHCVVLHSREPYSASKYASDLVSYAFNIRLNSKVW